MAQLKKENFKYEAENGECLEFQSTITVDSDGTFGFTFPEQLKDTISGLLAADMEAIRLSSKKYPGVYVSQPRIHWRVTGSTFNACANFLKDAMKAHMACTVTKELVIIYTTDMKVTYMKNMKTGMIYPNGTFEGASYGKDGNFCGTIDGSTHQHYCYQIGLAARVYEKITHSRPSGSKVQYVKDMRHHTERGSKMSPAGLLNTWNGLGQFDPSKGKEIPYTDKAALFFHQTMLSMCELADRLSAFFDDEKQVAIAIEHQASALLPLLKG